MNDVLTVLYSSFCSLVLMAWAAFFLARWICVWLYPLFLKTVVRNSNITLYIHTPGNYPKEDNIRFSQHGESLKTRVNNLISQ
jgi:hypothetical protein